MNEIEGPQAESLAQEAAQLLREQQALIDRMRGQLREAARMIEALQDVRYSAEYALGCIREARDHAVNAYSKSELGHAIDALEKHFPEPEVDP